MAFSRDIFHRRIKPFSRWFQRALDDTAEEVSRVSEIANALERVIRTPHEAGTGGGISNVVLAMVTGRKNAPLKMVPYDTPCFDGTGKGKGNEGVRYAPHAWLYVLSEVASFNLGQNTSGDEIPTAESPLNVTLCDPIGNASSCKMPKGPNYAVNGYEPFSSDVIGLSAGKFNAVTIDPLSQNAVELQRQPIDSHTLVLAYQSSMTYSLGPFDPPSPSPGDDPKDASGQQSDTGDVEEFEIPTSAVVPIWVFCAANVWSTKCWNCEPVDPPGLWAAGAGGSDSEKSSKPGGVY